MRHFDLSRERVAVRAGRTAQTLSAKADDEDSGEVEITHGNCSSRCPRGSKLPDAVGRRERNAAVTDPPVLAPQGVLGLDYSEELHGGAAVEAAGEEPPPEKGIQHRWQVVFMMAAAFVLCNMDKVRMGRRHSIGDRKTLGFLLYSAVLGAL